MEYNSGSNGASNFKIAHSADLTFTSELYDTKSYYQLIITITNV